MLRTSAFNIPIAPDRSCSDKRGMNNKAIKLKLLCFYTCIIIIALNASGRDCTNNNELLHKIGVLQRYAM